jgi:hypothetical protein
MAHIRGDTYFPHDAVPPVLVVTRRQYAPRHPVPQA